MAKANTPLFRALMIGSALTLLSACDEPFDFDLRGLGNGFDTSQAALAAAAPRPKPDDRGVISYPNYQVAVANRGDTIVDVANRVGLPPAQLAKYNGLPMDVALRKDEIIALPSRVAEPSPATGAIATGPIQPAETIDITTLAGSAIERAGPSKPSAITPAATPAAAAKPAAVAPKVQTGDEPERHKVVRGETAYSIARKYGVTVKALAEWNGLGTDLNLREGQYLLIPVAAEAPAPRAVENEPGKGTPTPVPPSAATPLPAEKATAAAPKAIPASPELAESRTSASSAARFALPVNGPIIRDYDKTKSAFILFKAAPGTAVKIADKGTVKLISKNADGVEIMVVDHGGGLQTAYSFIEGISVKKGASVSRGQTVAKVADNEFGALQFMVFKGTQTVDPTPYLN
ncbi:MAG: LysM peptidoglycan-binding domain-containing protein [Paracoccaceae bacterium]